MAEGHALRRIYGEGRADNAFAMTQSYLLAEQVAAHYAGISRNYSLVKKEQALIDSLLIDPVFLILSPAIVDTGEYAVVVDEFVNSKFLLRGVRLAVLGG